MRFVGNRIKPPSNAGKMVFVVATKADASFVVSTDKIA